MLVLARHVSNHHQTTLVFLHPCRILRWGTLICALSKMGPIQHWATEYWYNHPLRPGNSFFCHLWAVQKSQGFLILIQFGNQCQDSCEIHWSSRPVFFCPVISPRPLAMQSHLQSLRGKLNASHTSQTRYFLGMSVLEMMWQAESSLKHSKTLK